MNEYAVCWSGPDGWKGPESEPKPSPDSTLEAGLNAMAREGWELDSLMRFDNAPMYTLVFKREHAG